MDTTVVLQVEGLGYIKSLEHGMPSRKVGTRDSRLEAVDDEPTLISSAQQQRQILSRIEVKGLQGLQSRPAGGASTVLPSDHNGCYYEVTVSGSSSSGEEVHVYTGRYLATPFRTRAGEPRVVVKALTPAEREYLGDNTWSVVPVAVAINAGSEDGKADGISSEGGQMALQLPTLTEDSSYELVVDSRRVGHGCAAPTVHAS